MDDNMKPLTIRDVVRTSLPLVRAGVTCMPKHGVHMRFKGTEEELIQAGALRPDELPGPCRGSVRHVGSTRAARCTDGRINATVDGARAAKLDLGFQDFMHGLLADRQLSLVAHENGGLHEP